MGLFDEIKRSLQEALDEAQGKPAEQRQGQREGAGPQQPQPPPARGGESPTRQRGELYGDGGERRRGDIEAARRQQAAAATQRIQDEARRTQGLKDQAGLAQRQKKQAQRRLDEAMRERQLQQRRQQQSDTQRTAIGLEALRHSLKEPGALRQAIILTEILGQPLAKRPRNQRRSW
ncbi:MAG: hypothetical protein EA402_09020 [Planctomycetota bacterium]|nr:MAG: hypothetical protein EA402_09020 [Planctomycetota bacterium]